MREVLQNFYGAKYITSLDLSSDFLQVPLEQSSRQLMAFEFENNDRWVSSQKRDSYVRIAVIF